MESISLYKDALKITESSKLQRKVFDYWCNNNTDSVYQALAFDTETTGVTFGIPSFLHISEKTEIKMHNIAVFGISLCIPYKNKLALVWGRLGSELYDDCAKLLAIKGHKVAHNSKFDTKVCKCNNILVNSIVNCTMTMARIVWDRRMKFDLKDLALTVCPEMYGWGDELKALMRNIKSSYTRAGYEKGYANYSFLPNRIISKYAMVDAFVCWLLNLYLRPIINREFKKLYYRERKIISIVTAMEERGMQFDRNRAAAEIIKLNKQAVILTKKLKKLAKKDFNPRSPKQLLPTLLDIGVPKRLLRKKDKLSTEKPILLAAVDRIEKSLPKKFVNILLELRSCDKLNRTYMEPLYKRSSYNNGIVYYSINPTNTRTGRMSSSNPNLQNIPRPTSGFQKYNPVRKCFICRAGYTNLLPDYSQMEMWLFAIFANASKLIDALKRGEDAHDATAIMMCGKSAIGKDGKVKHSIRQKFKQVNFAMIYGMGFRGLAKYLHIPEVEAFDLRREYMDNIPEVPIFMDECKRRLIKYRYVKDMFGRHYHIPVRESYKAVNALVQGSCAQILKIALINLHKFMKHPSWSNYSLRPNLLVPVHDEIIIEIPTKALAYQKSCKFIAKNLHNTMEDIPELYPFGVRLKIDIKISNTSWEDKVKWNV